MPVGQQLTLLLDEQDAVETAQIEAHAPTLGFARQHLQQMTANPVPLPAGVTDEWVWYLYKAELAKEIDLLSREENERAATTHPNTVAVVPGSDRVVDLRAEKGDKDDVENSSSSESSDSDLSSYAPNKRFALKQYRPRGKRKRGKRKRRKKKRRKHSSSSSGESSDSDLLAETSNARRACIGEGPRQPAPPASSGIQGNIRGV